MHDETLAIHAGYEPDETKSVAVPIYQTVAYEFDDAQHGADLFNLAVPGYIYTRIMNPTQDVLEQRVAALEGGVAALATSAGMAAINYAILTISQAGNNIVSVPQLYGGTYTLFAHMLPDQGIDVRFAASDPAEDIEALIDDETTAVYCETSATRPATSPTSRRSAPWPTATASRSSSTTRSRRRHCSSPSSTASTSSCTR